MRKKVLLLALALVLSITGVVTGSTGSQGWPAWYTDSGYPENCMSQGITPSYCWNLVVEPVVICTLVQGGFTRTYFQNSTCSINFYRRPQ